MLAVSPALRSTNERHDENDESFPNGGGTVASVDDFPDFSSANLLDGIDFDDLFVGINCDEDVLPDLEMDPEILAAEFSSSLSGASGGEESQLTISSPLSVDKLNNEEVDANNNNSNCVTDVVTSKRDQESSNNSAASAVVAANNQSPNYYKEADYKGRKPSSSSATQSKNNNPPGKRKVKVDWTPELHRRFVQAVEQLGVDKAVPSRILELMGIDCLTRHNIASHLQKYRSHRKHLLAREAEAANWSQRRQIYGGNNITTGGKRDMNPWLIAPTMGFPPPMAPPPMPHFRPLHVWGHPSVDQSLLHVWPKHLAPSPPHPSPPPPPPPVAGAAVSWPPVAPATPPVDPSFWHSPHQRLTNPLTPGPPPFTPHLAPQARFSTPPVPGIPPPPTMYKVDPSSIAIPTPPPPPPTTTTGQPLPQPPAADFHPSKESIDAAIGDVLSKPWQPLPLGLKPPSVDSVLVELQRQGIPKVPPVCV